MISRPLRGRSWRTTKRVRLGLDYFDASINRVAAWVIGARNLLRALLQALLEPPGIRAAEQAGDNTARLALQEEARAEALLVRVVPSGPTCYTGSTSCFDPA